MVFASICEHASSAFTFASTSSDQFCHASSEHFVNFPVVGISILLTSFFLRQVVWLTPAKQDNRCKASQHASFRGSTNAFPAAYQQLYLI